MKNISLSIWWRYNCITFYAICYVIGSENMTNPTYVSVTEHSLEILLIVIVHRHVVPFTTKKHKVGSHR